jgi:hypothetical protein
MAMGRKVPRGGTRCSLFPSGPERGGSQWPGAVKAACERAAQARLRTRTDAQQSRKEREKADFPVRLTRQEPKFTLLELAPWLAQLFLNRTQLYQI